MHLSSDEIIFWRSGFLKLNQTIVTTWGLMALLTGGSALITRRLQAAVAISRWQSLLEIVVGMANRQIGEIGLDNPEKYLPYVATLFIFIATANLCTIIPWYQPPTGSLSTTTALALSVFIAVPVFGIADRGLTGYLRSYAEPTPIMIPFNIISELTRTMALAVRLFGNMMSGVMILAILLTISPLFFPVLMNLIGLLTGMVQAYIFSILATVYIAAAAGKPADRQHQQDQEKQPWTP
ncbi:MAG: F0F1 ATP synthase subunit A [Chlorobiaceae bacterium]|nr:F0F1 ATP synthase subunit A [Chlorobiaceae bacterium]